MKARESRSSTLGEIAVAPTKKVPLPWGFSYFDFIYVSHTISVLPLRWEWEVYPLIPHFYERSLVYDLHLLRKRDLDPHP